MHLAVFLMYLIRDKFGEFTDESVLFNDEFMYILSLNYFILSLVERLYAKPVLTQGAVNQTKLFGQTAEFSCEFLSDMHLAVYWMYFTKDEFVYNDTWVDENKESIVYFDSNKIMTVRVTD